MSDSTPTGLHGRDYVYCDLCAAAIPLTAGTRYHIATPVTVLGADEYGPDETHGLSDYVCAACWDGITGGPDAPER